MFQHTSSLAIEQAPTRAADEPAVGAVDIKETTTTRIDGKATSPQYSITIDLKGLTMPSAVGPVTGSKKMPMTIGGHQMDALVNWTISPIR
ncbi:MAG TPA: hypothetical protein VGQ30_07895 [Gemmatimonadaceae bacterium]|nr:hypothetical protein [Gemmatimonadaceae bacterium]